jgi:DNA-binding transcriptional LysR family regulator
VNRAARRLQMAQPPLSQQIKHLERELGMPLFHRSPKGMDLTPAGEGLLREAYQVLRDMDRIVPRVRAAGAGHTGYLSIGCVPVGVAGLLSSLLRRFRATYPQVQLEAHGLHSREQYEALEARVIDLAILRSWAPTRHFESRLVLKEKIILALPNDHYLCEPPEVRIRDLTNEGFIFYSRQRGPLYFDSLVRLCQDEGGFSPTIKSQQNDLLTMLGIVSAGMGIALVSELTQQFQVPGVTFRELHEVQARLPLFMLWDTGRRNPAIDNFHKILDTWSANTAWEPPKTSQPLQRPSPR